MFEVVTGSRRPLCNGTSRRDFLRAGLFALPGLGGMGRGARASDPTAAGPAVRDKSVVFLFLAGGPSQYETFDPKPGGPDGFTSIKGHIPTSLPGVRFASYLPKLAGLADRLTVVRSFQTKHSEHDGAHKQMMTADLTVQDGRPVTAPGLGALYARAAGAANPATGLPRHALVPPTTRNAKGRAGFNGSYEGVVAGCQPALLGTAFSPFEVAAPASEGFVEQKKRGGQKATEPAAPDPLGVFVPGVPLPQLDARLDLLKQLDTLDRRADAAGAMGRLDTFTARAADLLRTGTVRNALDLSLEAPATVRAYDTEHFPNWNCDDNSRFVRSGPSVGFSLGRQLLMARRLCEAGAGFVTVVCANWDFHARKGIPNTPEGMGVFGPPLDHAVSAFLEDVRARGLEDKILLVVTGEFGRSGLDKNLGRHHHPKSCPLVLAGGGLRHGQVVGQTDRRGSEPAADPIRIADLHATVLHTLLDVGRLRGDAAAPAAVLDRATNGTPIRELFS
ncbi:hypothetical protein : Uncharacterized protein OS=Planctomyces maris DSM 8797 GN=PM8797T_09159 PE=4 SV=1: DUF1501 [Gemmataceae bacterium]|nr:hypothetical protein : Uncharacterized protein OS=Planctomyces maris DSM 8797 GN=PM8797T_09159 PE=4 SV=1: DUF1501 [Gemmataceae bacterium]VTT99769.1 hypothetical protein : Uncharacterized protein OS=Planctomyces maris DSM 8797 GN=PM8797T_09159 PE=4 SV=1: DUF1501 [Gemmataceae bacterium]